MHAHTRGMGIHAHKNNPKPPLQHPHMTKRHNLSKNVDKRLIGFNKRFYPGAQQTLPIAYASACE